MVRWHIGDISFGYVLFANVILAWHDSAVVDILKYGQCFESAAEITNRLVP